MRGDEVDGRATKPLVKKQDTEEEDIDELVRTFKESEAAVPKDSGDAGKPHSGFISALKS